MTAVLAEFKHDLTAAWKVGAFNLNSPELHWRHVCDACHVLHTGSHPNTSRSSVFNLYSLYFEN